MRPPAQLGYSAGVSARTTSPRTAAGVPDAVGLMPSGPAPLPTSLIAREAEIDALLQMVTARGFRAGLLLGERGVGKTSLLRAGLVPQLAEQGIVALYCDDIRNPIASLAAAVNALTGLAPEDGEALIPFLDRVVSRNLAGKQVVLVLDHMEDALTTGDEALMSDLGDLFARVVTRSSGRGRFLFACDSAHVHRFGVLEQRTGSLFPPSSRFELARLDPDRARAVLAHMLERRHASTAPALVDAVVQGMIREGPILPADLQTAAVAMAALGLASPAGLNHLQGSVLEALERAWIDAAARATGRSQAALCILGELAIEQRPVPRTPSWLAARLGIAAEDAAELLMHLQHQGLVVALSPAAGPDGAPAEPGFVLAHAGLRPPVREVAAPAIAAARRLRELLTARVERGKRLTLVEYLRLRAARFAPATSQERAVLARTKQLYTIVAAVIVAAPLVFLISVYVAMSGSYYLDVDQARGSGARVLVRAGRPGLSAFDWLPASPGFGSVIADPGLSRPMVSDAAWQRARDRDITGDVDGDAYAAAALDALDPALAALITYAIDGSSAALATLQSQAAGPRELTAVLEALAPIARGTAEEVAFIEQALNDTSPVVQAAALGVAAQAARRQPERYRDTLARALAAGNPDLRRLAFAAVRDLGDATAEQIFRAALGESPDPPARNQLLAEIAALEDTTMPSPGTAVSILVNRDIPERTRANAREALRRAFTTAPADAAAAAAKLVSNPEALPEDQVWTLELMRDLAPQDSYEAIAGDIKAALASESQPVREAALPVYARIAPRDAAAELAVLRKNPEPGETLLVAMARAWGEVARIGEPAAGMALEELIGDGAPPQVRIVAAEAYGNVGRGAVATLNDLAKKARFDVAAGAVLGLANAVQRGAPRGMATSGITNMWRRKGRPRRAAAEAFARLASTHARNVYSYLSTAARTSDDTELRVIGVQGLCRAGVAGHGPSRRMLVRASLDGESEVRRVVIQCVSDNTLDTETATTIAVRLARDGDTGIRADAARALLRVIQAGEAPEAVAREVVRLVGDREREVRAIAARALTAMGAKAPEDAGQALVRAYERADEDEKLELLGVARATGSGDLVAPAMADRAPAVRIAALDTAIATRAGVAATLNAAFTDSDPAVRRAALARIADHADQIDADAMSKSLRLALHDPDPGIARLALTSLVRLGAADEVVERLRTALTERSEGRRTRAAAAGVGLVERDAKAAVTVLEPLLDDPSNDVRSAMLPALAAAYAATRSADELAAMLRESERHATRRLAATAAFVVLARADDQRDATLAALGAVAGDEDTPPMARLTARLGAGLIESGADGLSFLTMLVP